MGPKEQMRLAHTKHICAVNKNRRGRADLGPTERKEEFPTVPGGQLPTGWRKNELESPRKRRGQLGTAVVQLLGGWFGSA